VGCVLKAIQNTLFDGPAHGTPSEFLDETYAAKTRGIELLYGENCIILTSTVFNDPPVWQTDRQTDGRTSNIARSAHAASAKNGTMRPCGPKVHFSGNHWAERGEGL